jgi:hypothetical protein
MDLATLLPRLARRWWVVATVAMLAVVGAAISLASRTDEHKNTIHFVLRPDASVPNSDLPNALEVLKSDGALVQTVRGVLDSQELLRQAAADSHVTLSPAYTVDATARPGSALLDSTLTGPDAATVDRLAVGFGRAASDYVAANYSAYALDRLGADSAGGGGGLGAAQVIVLAALLGAALGVGLVAAELRLEPSLQPLRDRRAARQDARASEMRCLARTSKGGRCRNRAVDERGYCRMHLARIEEDRADRRGHNGSGGVIRLPEPDVRRIEPADRRRARGRDEDEA